MIAIIALLHALPIFLFTWWYSSKFGIFVVAGISAFVAMGTGAAHFLIWDLGAIAFAVWNCLKVVNNRSEKIKPITVAKLPLSPPMRPMTSPKKLNADNIWMEFFITIIGFIMVGMQFYENVMIFLAWVKRSIF